VCVCVRVRCAHAHVVASLQVCTNNVECMTTGSRVSACVRCVHTSTLSFTHPHAQQPTPRPTSATNTNTNTGGTQASSKPTQPTQSNKDGSSANMGTNASASSPSGGGAGTVVVVIVVVILVALVTALGVVCGTKRPVRITRHVSLACHHKHTTPRRRACTQRCEPSCRGASRRRASSAVCTPTPPVCSLTTSLRNVRLLTMNEHMTYDMYAHSLFLVEIATANVRDAFSSDLTRLWMS
jgi:hypothetical protein